MNDPNKGISKNILAQQKDVSYERLRLQLFEVVEAKLEEFDMTWDDLAEQLKWKVYTGVIHTGDQIRASIGGDRIITLEELNDIANCFSAEAYVIFRPRFPITQT